MPQKSSVIPITHHNDEVTQQLHNNGQLCEVWQTTWFGTDERAGYDFNSLMSG